MSYTAQLSSEQFKPFQAFKLGGSSPMHAYLWLSPPPPPHPTPA